MIMYSPFHKLLIKTEGTIVNKPLLSYYYYLSNYYSLLTNTLGCVNNFIHNDPIYNTIKLGERIPTLNIIREVHEMLKQHGFLDYTDSDNAYDAQTHLETFSFDFSNMKNREFNFLKGIHHGSDAETTFITEETQFSDDDISLSDLDEFVSLMQSCAAED